MRGVRPADAYFRSVGGCDAGTLPIFLRGRLERDNHLPEWCAAALSFAVPAGRRTPPRFGRPSAQYLCQQLQERPYAAPRYAIAHRLTGGALVCYDPGELAISITHADKIVCSRTDPCLAFITNIAVGDLGLFFVADLAVGATMAFRAEYREGPSFTALGRFDSDTVTRSVVSDIDGLCATACGRRMTLWHVFTGETHRVIEFEAEVSAMAFDSEFSCLFVATKEKLAFVTVDGETICQGVNDLGITAAACVRLPMGELERAVVCGAAGGVVLLVSPGWENSSLRVRKLNSLHKSDVKEVIADGNAVFTVDAEGEVCVWTCVGVQAVIRPELFRRCADCDEKPVEGCPKCNRMLCMKCLQEHYPGRCLGFDGFC
jgi:hypothetical protein